MNTIVAYALFIMFLAIITSSLVVGVLWSVMHMGNIDSGYSLSEVFRRSFEISTILSVAALKVPQ